MKILLADDEPIARTMLEHWLTGWGYGVTTVKDGEQALDALRADPEIKLAVVDWVMPKLDGIGLCRKIRSGPNEPYIYVLLLTARDNKADIVEGLDAGADDYLVKPCNPLELKVRLRAGRRIVELQEQLVSARESLRFEAMHDGLTGLLNRRAILEQLDRELLRAARRGAPVAVALADFDHFKSVNDVHGHSAGDSVLREAARRMKTGVRAYDSIGRFGGEEILCVLPECTATEALAISERLANVVTQVPIATASATIPITLSVGVASTEQCSSANAEQLMRAADVALGRAKRAGMSQSCLATPQDFGTRRSGEFGLIQTASSS